MDTEISIILAAGRSRAGLDMDRTLAMFGKAVQDELPALIRRLEVVVQREA